MKQQLMMLLLGTASVFCSCETQVEQHEKNELRAPAYPLVTIDPYTSAWSTTDNLYDSPVKHWTGKDFSLLGVAKVDGQTYRFMGTEELELFPIISLKSSLSSWKENNCCHGAHSIMSARARRTAKGAYFHNTNPLNRKPGNPAPQGCTPG